ncbi:MCE family protein [Gordonia sp. TBRC 11910]|uniref:MCE family protein n=1 Tax=Gordonia asplenii TaxID=2725283 RepID=A0A848KZ64_9ACTN|nr:MlaD family protein [Gordonia asplenii]NMO00738.1 MCE family protein [Gordonia asplenii]
MMSVNKELGINVVTFAVVIATCGLYLAVGVYRWNPLTEYSTVSMHLTNTDLVLGGTGVFVDGVRVGEVSTVNVTPTGADVTLRYPKEQQISRDASVEISMQSALGEPYINFVSGSGNGPYLVDGERIAAQQLVQPESIPGIFDLINNLSSALAADPMASLLRTVWQALDGTDQALGQISDGSRLIAGVLLSRSTQLRTMFANTQRYTGDLGWLIAAAPQLGTGLGRTMTSVGNVLPVLERVVDGSDFAKNLPIIDPFLARLHEYLAKIIPPTMDAVGPLMPIATALNQTLPQVNVSQLLSNALQMFGTDGAARLVVTVPPK